ncbi:MAG: hypothetical protein WCG47_15805 [Dermatophilaceae bacterium]
MPIRYLSDPELARQGDRSLDTFKAFVLKDLSDSVIVHDRYQSYGSAEVYPESVWPVQIADALRALIHQANLARDQGRDAIPDNLTHELYQRFGQGVLVGLSDTTSHGTRVPGNAKHGCCCRSCASAKATSCASPGT